MNPMTSPHYLKLAERLYRLLLGLYPAEFRREYGALMLQLFRDVARERYQRQGIAGVALWWGKALLDLALTVPAEYRQKYRQRKNTMSKAALVQLTGVLLSVGGTLCALAAFGYLQPDDHYRFYGIYRWLIWLYTPGLMLVGFGMLGLGLGEVQMQAGGRAMQAALYIGGGSALVMGLSVTAVVLYELLWSVYFISGFIFTLALTAFGLLYLRQPLLPIFRLLPLQIALGWLILLTGLVETLPQATGNLLNGLFGLGFGLAWLAIGLVLRRQRQRWQPA